MGPYYRGARFQRGHGIGSFLSGLFRAALPILRSGAAAVGREAARAGANILSDVTSGSGTFRESLKRRAGEAGLNLSDKLQGTVSGMTGRGAIKRRRITVKSRQSKTGKGRKRTSGKSRKKVKSAPRGRRPAGVKRKRTVQSKKKKKAPAKRRKPQSKKKKSVTRKAPVTDFFGRL